jgi:hypothetical protein
MLSKSNVLNTLLFLGAIGLLAGSFAFSLFSNYVSYWNYPGGDAIKFFNRDYCKPGGRIHFLHDIVLEIQRNPALPKPYIHSDVYTTMTGFTRFMHEHDTISESPLGWRYNKTENMPDSEYHVYTHLLSDRNNYTGFV